MQEQELGELGALCSYFFVALFIELWLAKLPLAQELKENLVDLPFLFLRGKVIMHSSSPMISSFVALSDVNFVSALQPFYLPLQERTF